MTERRIPNLSIYQDTQGGWRWRLRSPNGEIVADGESYTRKVDAERGWMDALATTLAWASAAGLAYDPDTRTLVGNVEPTPAEVPGQMALGEPAVGDYDEGDQGGGET